MAVDTGSGYTVSSTAGSANVLVHDDDATPSSITLSVNDNSVAEGDSPAPSITVTATVDGSTQFGFNQTVTVSVTPRADDATTNYVDMTAVSDFAITIPAGAASHSQSFTLTPDDDVVDETNNTVTVSGSISGDSATTINSVSITLTDDDATPTAITLSANPSTITENGGGQTITVTAAVTGTTFGVAKTVAVVVAGHDTAGAVQFSQVSNFNINIAAEAASGQNTFTLTPTDNNTVDNSGEATISGMLDGATVAAASVAITDDDASGPVTVAMAASNGDANGNAVEGANDTTGYRTITIALGRALTGAETVTVPLTADGATVTTDYTFGLQPTSQTGVSLTTTGGTHTAQNPAVVFTSGGQTATLRLTPVDNNDRTQPYVVIDYGTGARVPSVSGVTLGDVTGGPIGIVLVDDETGDIEVPSSWGLKPSAVARGGTFRLIYVTSQTRNAEATVIDVYNAFVRNVTAAGGHTNLKPYAGLATVIGSTAVTDARDNTGTTGAGVPIYWLNGAKVADDYADFYDGSWDSSQFRNESGSVAGGVFSIWTGSNADGTKNNSPLGNTSFVRYGDSRSDRNQNHLNDGGSAPDNQNRLYALSPVFTVEAPLADPVISITAGASPVTEGTAATFTVTATPAPAANLTVNLTVVQTGDFGATPTGSQTVTIPTTGSATFTVSTTGDTVDDANGSVAVTVGTGTGYTVSSTSGSATVAVNDDDATPTAITLSVDDNSVSENDSPAPTISVTATVDGSTQFGVAKTVRVSVTPRSDTTSVNYVDMTAVSDFDITIPAGTASHSQSFTLTPDNDIVDESDNTVTVSGSISGDSATTINSATITLADDDATPTAITLSASPSTITEDGGGQTITVTAAVGGTRFGVAKTVAVAVAGHDTAGAVQFSQVSNFNINIVAEAASGQNTFTLTPTNNNTPDNDGEAAISGTLANATVAGASVTITNDDSAPVTVAMAASDGDANGNVVEGANNASGYRTITITLGRALTSSETVTVPLTVVGATVTTDHTFGLRGTNTGVTLTTSGTHTAQNPAVVFTSGGQTATLRLTPVDNNARTQPYVVIDYGTGARVPSVSGVTLGDVTGGPIGVVLVDDETGDIEVPSSWGLAPSGLSGGDDFRLLFRTSTGRDATSSNIAVYDAFVRGVLAGAGHNDIKPYAGFFKVFGGTRSTSGSTGTAARVHNGMATAHTGHLQNGPWTDGSTRATVGNAAGVPTYWLNGAILANNYADLCDLDWSSGSGVTTGWDTDDPRNEDGTRNIPTGAISNYAPYETWTGSGNACEAYDHPLGASTVSRSSADSGGGQSLLHGSAEANTGIHPFYGYSPVFKIEDTTAPSEVTVAADWALIPSGISAGGKFRLLFVTSTQRDASATDIATYNTFVQNRAAAGHTAIRSHSAEFRVVASTASVDARDNSATTGSGVPIYWLGGSNSNRVADNYADFYDGNWDSYVNTNENGADTGNGSGAGNATVWTGSNDNGTKDSSNYLGASSVQYGQLFLATTNDPFTRFTSGNGTPRNFYGLSPVYTVQAAAVVPELTFSSATYSGAEDGGTISVTVNASSAPMSALTVNLGKTDGTATGGGVDFTNPAATFTFPASVTSHDFTVSITDDMILENHENFTLTLQSGTGYTVGTPASTTVTITDQDTVTLRLEDATDTVSEDDGSVTITVLKDGDADIPVQATLTPSDGTATGGSDPTVAGIDYDHDPVTPITIPAGVSSVDLAIAINDDSLAEASETFSVALTAVGGQRGVSVASPSSATVTITDNDNANSTTVWLQATEVRTFGDPPVTDRFSVDEVTVGEDGSDSARITVGLSRRLAAGETVTAPLTVSGAGISDSDYAISLSTGSGLNAGVTLDTSAPYSAARPAVVFTGHATDEVRFAILLVRAVQDTANEGAETLTLGIGAVTDNLPGVTDVPARLSTARVTIKDDEPTVSLAVPDSVAVEGDANRAAFVELRLAGPVPSGQTLNVTYSLDLNATVSLDGTQSGRTITATRSSTSTGTVTFTGPLADKPTARLKVAASNNTVNGWSSGIHTADFKLTGATGISGADPTAAAGRGAKLFVIDSATRSGGQYKTTTMQVEGGTAHGSRNVWEGNTATLLLSGTAGASVPPEGTSKGYSGGYEVLIGVENLTTDFGDLGRAYAKTYGGAAYSYVAHYRRDSAANTDYYKVYVTGRGKPGAFEIPVLNDGSGEGDQQFRVFIAETPRYMGVGGRNNDLFATASMDFTIPANGGSARAEAEETPAAQAPEAQTVQTPTEAVANLKATEVDETNAKATWDAVAHARSYQVDWEAEGDSGLVVAGAGPSVTGTSVSIRHDAPEPMTLTVTVTPEYVDANGNVVVLDALAGTATLEVGPRPLDGGGGTNGGGDGGPIQAGEGEAPGASAFRIPVAHWRLNGDALDWAGSSHGTVGGGAVFAANDEGEGIGTHSLSLDGSDDHVDLASHVSNFPLGDAARSVAGWFRADAGNQRQTFFTYGPNVAGQRFSIAADRTQVLVAVSGHAWGVSGLSLDDGWHHVAVTYAGGDSDSTSIYLDGALQPASTLVGAPQSVDTRAGPAAIGRNVSGDAHYAGSIDDVRIYDVALGAEQVLALFNEHSQTPPPPPPPPPVTTAVAATATPALAEGNLDGASVELSLDAGEFAATVAAADVTASGVSGVSVSSATRDSDTQATATLAFDGTDFDADATLTLTVSAAALAHSDTDLSATLPVTAVNEPPPPPPPPPAVSIPAPVVHWKFDGDADDSAGSSHGAVRNGASFTTAASVGSHALSLDGSDDFVDLDPYVSGFLRGNSARSVTGWFRADAGNQRQTFFTYGPNAEGRRFAIAADRTQALVAVTGHAWGVNNLSLADGWHHIAVTFAGSRSDEFSIYLNGVKQPASTLGGSARQVDTRSGTAAIGRNVGGNAHYGGDIDDVRVYGYALSAEQVRAIAGRQETASVQYGALATAAMHGGLLPTTLALPRASDGADGTGAGAFATDAIGASLATASSSQAHAPLLPSASNPLREGLVRIVNPSAQAGEVQIVAIDDAGRRSTPVTLGIVAGASAQFTSRDLEWGNAALGLSGSTGPGTGDWRLEVSSGLDIELLPYARTADGTLSAMRDVVAAEGNVHRVALFNPADSPDAASRLRLTNRGAQALRADITGIDDTGASPGSTVSVEIAADESVLLTAAELESGGTGLLGALGDGEGQWRLDIASDGDLAVMNLVETPDGRLTNLSNATATTVPARKAHVVDRFPSSSDLSNEQGVVRIVNSTESPASIRIEPHDSTGWDYAPLTLTLGANEAANLGAWDLELGNAAKNLSGNAGPGTGGAWRLEISSDSDIEVLTYTRTPNGPFNPPPGDPDTKDKAR